jgi:hypothetical protein
MGDKYILKDKITVPEDDLMKWGTSLQKRENTIVAKTDIGGIHVSTVFLGLDHRFGEGEPLLFETMIFNSDDEAFEGYQERYTAWQEAEAGHKRAVKLVNEHVKGAKMDKKQPITYTEEEVALLINELFWVLRRNPLTPQGKLSAKGLNEWWDKKKIEHVKGSK